MVPEVSSKFIISNLRNPITSDTVSYARIMDTQLYRCQNPKSLYEVHLEHVSVVVTYLMRTRVELNGVCNSTGSVCGIHKHHCQRNMQNGKCRMWKNVKSLWKSKWNVWYFHTTHSLHRWISHCSNFIPCSLWTILWYRIFSEYEWHVIFLRLSRLRCSPCCHLLVVVLNITNE